MVWKGDILDMADQKEDRKTLKDMFKKDVEPPRWDNGREDEDDEPADPDVGFRFSQKVMSVYGIIAGALGAQFAKYLHQVFACNAYGIPLTSRKVAWYSTPQIAADVIIFFFLYAAILGVGLLIGLGLQAVFMPESDNPKEDRQRVLSRGFFWLVVISTIFFFLPVNVFLIGVP